MEFGYLLAKGLRLGGSIYLIFLAIKLFRLFRQHRSKELAIVLAFTFGLLGFLLAPLPFQFKEIKYLAFPFLFGAWSVPYIVFLMADIFFAEEFQFKPSHLITLISIETVQFFLFYSSITPMPHWLYEDNSTLSLFMHIILPRIISTFFAVLAIWKVLGGKDDDLIESRRSNRNQFIVYTSVLIFIVVGSEVFNYIFGHSNFVEAISIILVIILIYQVTEESTKPKPFWLNEPKTIASSKDDNKLIIEELSRLLIQDKIFKSPEINIRGLAKLLKAPEYKVRQIINEDFGFNHFKSFLNHYRIEEAKQLLSDPAKNDIPIFNLAQDVGFGSLASFNRVFKQIVGVAPTQFRSSSSTEN